MSRRARAGAGSLGVVGAGKMGSVLARLAVGAGIDVVIANSRGPRTLEPLVDELGGHARAGTVEQALNADWAVILAIPMLEVQRLPRERLTGRVVIDVSNYYPVRDGRVEPLDSHEVTEAELVASWLSGSRYAKAFSNMFAHHLAQLARDPGAPDRTGLPIAADDVVAMRTAMQVVEVLGFDPVDAGPLREAWRFEPEAAGFTQLYLADPDPSEDQLLESAMAPGAPVPAAAVEAAVVSADRVVVSARTF